jgi:ATP-dependent Lhr-like helicase
MARRWLDPETASDLGRLDEAAIARVREEAWPTATTADELHDALRGLGVLTAQEIAKGDGWARLFDMLVAARRATRMKVGGAELHVAAEGLPQLALVHARAKLHPVIRAPAEFEGRFVTRELALADLVRSRLESSGPVTVEQVAQSLVVPESEVDAALASLAAQGIAMSGRFTPGLGVTEWCDRGLLARIHRYTVKRLREQIEPVSTQDFMRFLMRWQHLVPAERRQGPDALDAVITQLQGFEAPAAAWEAEILPARLDDYDFTWLDDLCLSGRATWTRLTRPSGGSTHGSGPIRTSPIALLPRRAAPLWNRLAAVGEPPAVSARAQRVADFLTQHGASFFDEIVDGVAQLRTHVEEALAELVVAGMVTSDSFGGLRALLTPSDKRKPFGSRRGHRRSLFGIEDSGRWALRKRVPAAEDVAALEPIVHALLRRYGIIFWRMLQREAAWLPPWRELLHVLRRMEARGDIRGGRFVAGISGEQFATPDAVSALRDARRAPTAGELIVVSGADPLNLAGIILPGAKVPALTGNRIVFRDGAPVATLVSGEVRFMELLEPDAAALAEDLLLRRRAGSPLLAYLR